MKTLFRILLTFLSFIASHYFLYWVVFAIIFDDPNIPSFSLIASLVLGAAIAYFVWKQTGSVSDGLATHIFLGGIILGSISFVAGFFGPIIFSPGANQGPLLGFVTGPLGFLLGLIGGGIYWLIKVKK